MRLLRALLLILATASLFGCITPLGPSGPLQPQEGANVTPSCKTVVSQEPYSESVCQNVSRMEEVCANRELDYSLSDITVINLCLESSLCTARYSDGTCVSYLCSKGMMRCMANLTNLDKQKAGTWSVGSTFAFKGAVFDKNPQTKTLLPKETGVFDFSHFYDMDLNQPKPVCRIFVASPAKLQDCNFITRIEEECQNVTKYRTVEKEVCG